MAFCSSYQRIMENNLQHVHRQGPDIKLFRRRPYQQKSSTENSSTFHETFALRYSEYVPKYKTRLPKAAGFQSLSQSRIDENVKRMSTPNKAAQSQKEPEKDSKPRSPFRKLTDDEERLLGECLNQPTSSTIIRKLLRTKGPMNVQDVDMSCPKCRQPLSKRKLSTNYTNYFHPQRVTVKPKWRVSKRTQLV